MQHVHLANALEDKYLSYIVFLAVISLNRFFQCGQPILHLVIILLAHIDDCRLEQLRTPQDGAVPLRPDESCMPITPLSRSS